MRSAAPSFISPRSGVDRSLLIQNFTDMRKRDLKTGMLICLLLQIHCLSGSAIERISAIGARESAMALAVVCPSGTFFNFSKPGLFGRGEIFFPEPLIPATLAHQRLPRKRPFIGLSYSFGCIGPWSGTIRCGHLQKPVFPLQWQKNLPGSCQEEPVSTIFS